MTPVYGRHPHSLLNYISDFHRPALDELDPVAIGIYNESELVVVTFDGHRLGLERYFNAPFFELRYSGPAASRTKRRPLQSLQKVHIHTGAVYRCCVHR